MEFQTSLTKVEQMADSAPKIGVIVQNDICSLQRHEMWARDKILYLKNALYCQQLKFQGLPEGEEGTTDLSIFMATWVSSVLNLEDNIAPIIMKAFRMGRKDCLNPARPRNILLEFHDDHTIKEYDI